MVRPSALAVLRLITSLNWVAPIEPEARSAWHSLGDSRGVVADWTICPFKLGAIAHQAACNNILAQWVHYRNSMAGGERHDLLAPGREEWISTDNKRAHPLLDRRSEGKLNFEFLCWRLRTTNGRSEVKLQLLSPVFQPR